MRLIDADALKNAMYTETMLKDTDMQRWDSGCWIRYKLFENVLREQPTVDAVPVRRGKWIRKGDGHLLQCEFCNRHIREPFGYMFKYCPNCGANMMEEKC